MDRGGLDDDLGVILGGQIFFADSGEGVASIFVGVAVLGVELDHFAVVDDGLAVGVGEARLGRLASHVGRGLGHGGPVRGLGELELLAGRVGRGAGQTDLLPRAAAAEEELAVGRREEGGVAVDVADDVLGIVLEGAVELRVDPHGDGVGLPLDAHAGGARPGLRAQLGGQAANLYRTWRGEDIQSSLGALRESVRTDPNIEIYLETELAGVEGFVGNFESTLEMKEGVKTVQYGAAILATGAREHRTEEYLYGKDPRVVTHLELDRRYIKGDPSLGDIGSAVFIQCVGSREPKRPYCSRVCCTHAVEGAIHLKELNPEADVFILYRDIRTYGEKEALYTRAREAGITFPVAMTRTVWGKYVEVPKGVIGQDVSGRLWDILYMMRWAIKKSRGPSGLIFFKLYVRNTNRRPKLVTLKAVCGPGDQGEPVITIMKPEED